MAEMENPKGKSFAGLQTLDEVARYMELMRNVNADLYDLVMRCAQDGELTSYHEHVPGLVSLGLITGEAPYVWKPTELLLEYFQSTCKSDMSNGSGDGSLGGGEMGTDLRAPLSEDGVSWEQGPFNQSDKRGSILVGQYKGEQKVLIVLGCPDRSSVKVLMMPEQAEKSFVIASLEQNWRVTSERQAQSVVGEDRAQEFLSALENIRSTEFVIPPKKNVQVSEPEEPGILRSVYRPDVGQNTGDIVPEVIEEQPLGSIPQEPEVLTSSPPHERPSRKRPTSIKNEVDTPVALWFKEKVVPVILEARATNDYSKLSSALWMKEGAEQRNNSLKAVRVLTGRQKAFYEMLQIASSKHAEHLDGNPVTDDEIEKIKQASESQRKKTISEKRTIYSPEYCTEWVMRELKPYVLDVQRRGDEEALKPTVLIEKFGYPIRKVALVLSKGQVGENGTTAVSWLLNQLNSGFESDSQGNIPPSI